MTKTVYSTLLACSVAVVAACAHMQPLSPGEAARTITFDEAQSSSLASAFGTFTFPAATRVANSTIVRFVAGYSSGSSGVPEQAKTTLKKMIARAYEFRGDPAAGEAASLMDEVVLDELALPEWG